VTACRVSSARRDVRQARQRNREARKREQPLSSPPTQSGAAATRERILDAAEELFAARGLAGTAVRDIASRIGLTAPSLYNHFSSKRELYEAVLERGVRPLLELMEDLGSRDQTTEAREAFIAQIMERLSRRPHVPRLIQHEVIGGGEYLGKLARSWIRPILQQGMAEMKRDGDSYWAEHEYPLMMSAWLNLVFGHFTMAPMLGVVFDDDPLSAEALTRQTQFLQKLARTMSAGAPPVTPSSAAVGRTGDAPAEDASATADGLPKAPPEKGTAT
jgi:AcrR family transcriptional regulator